MQPSATTSQPASATTVIRDATLEDADRCAEIFYDAFEAIASRHHFPTEPASRDFTAYKTREMLADPGFAGLIAERDGEVLGSAFVDRRSEIAGVGPVTVHPAAQDAGIGRALTSAALERERERGTVGVRLVQTAYHYRSLALYATLGFVVREPLSVLQGPPPALCIPGREVRPAGDADVDPCSELCRRVHGHARDRELQSAVAAGTARVVEDDARITGYATGLGYGWHAVAEANADLMALLAAAEGFPGLGILVPSRNAELLRWCLQHGLRIVQQSTLMTTGLYSEPAGVWLPSILF